MKRLVIDASVAIKWVVEEPGTEDALKLRRHRLLAPDLLIADCADILAKKARRGELSPREASLAARLLERADIELHPMRPQLDAILQQVQATGWSAYACAYLALARQEDCALVIAGDRTGSESDALQLPVAILSLADAARMRT